MNWRERYAMNNQDYIRYQQLQRVRQRNIDKERRSPEAPIPAPADRFCEAADCGKKHPFGRRWKLNLSTGLRLCTQCRDRVCEAARDCLHLAPHGESWPTSSSVDGPKACPEHK